MIILNMPARNIVKIYIDNGYYHIYNRGVGKRNIFKDSQDYTVFLGYIKDALDKPVDYLSQGATLYELSRIPKNFFNQIQLLAYCLMPNHFHLLLSQLLKDNMTDFLRSISTRYSMYFNKKYNRVGGLFQGHYKAVQVLNDSYLLHLSRYIHMNPQKNYKDLTRAYSSYADYLHLRNTEWVKTEHILKYFENKVAPEFKKFNSYKKLVENNKKDPADIIGKLILED